MGKTGFDYGMRETKCDTCGKLFYIYGAEWAYQNRKGKKILYFCSYTCSKGKEARIKRDEIWRKKDGTVKH